LATFEEVRRVKEKYESLLMRKKGVIGCSAGYKTTSSKRTLEPAVICYVVKKISPEALSETDRIPEELDGVSTDVVETGEIRALR
jgi:hypothetical protein